MIIISIEEIVVSEKIINYHVIFSLKNVQQKYLKEGGGNSNIYLSNIRVVFQSYS